MVVETTCLDTERCCDIELYVKTFASTLLEYDRLNHLRDYMYAFCNNLEEDESTKPF